MRANFTKADTWHADDADKDDSGTDAGCSEPAELSLPTRMLQRRWTVQSRSAAIRHRLLPVAPTRPRSTN